MIESWTRITEAPFARVNHQAIFLGDNLYIFGGVLGDLTSLDQQMQMDVFSWNNRQNQWEKIPSPLPLRYFNCETEQWSTESLTSGSLLPSHRFGHTVVSWRGRGWLFGGRTARANCSDQLYLFDPGLNCSCVSSLRGISGSSGFAVDRAHPFWAEIVGLHGSPPSPRDGHAAVVHESAMFIFGGFVSLTDGYDNRVYRLDFYTWSWTQIQIDQPPRPIPVSSDGEDSDEAEVDQSLVPLPRDFPSLISHHGRLFMFGGRSETARGHDVYDSALWELFPLEVVTQSDSTEQLVCHSVPAVCQYCSPATFDRLGTMNCLLRLAWEEQTGNWDNSCPWMKCPPRPCCLWRLLPDCPPQDRIDSLEASSIRIPDSHSSRWSSGLARWRQLHRGHGIQKPDKTIADLLDASRRSPSFKPLSPFGRRSASTWAYAGDLYFAFGVMSNEYRDSSHLHYDDVWRFSLRNQTWHQLPFRRGTSHWPVERRRATASVYYPRPFTSAVSTHSQSPLVFLFGGTHPRVLSNVQTECRRNSQSDPVCNDRVVESDDQLVLINREFSSHSAPSDARIPGAPSLVADTTSPVAVCLIHPTHSPVLFTIVLILPSLLQAPSSSSVPCHLPTLSGLYVIRLTEVDSLFTSQSAATYPVGHGNINTLLHSPDSGLDPIQMYHMLRTAWLSYRSIPPASSRSHRHSLQEQHSIRLLLVQPTACSSLLSTGGRSLSPIVLEQHSFSCNSNGLVYHELSSACYENQNFLRFALYRSTWFTVLDLLDRCVQHSHDNAHQHDWDRSPVSFQSDILVPCTDCSQLPSPHRAVHVWADTHQLVASMPLNRNEAQNTAHFALTDVASAIVAFLRRCFLELRLLLSMALPIYSSLSSALRSGSNHARHHPQSSSGTCELSDSQDGEPTEIDLIPHLGTLVRGKTKLCELSDFYLFHLDTTLYDMCLRRLHMTGLNKQRLQAILPQHIFQDYTRIYSRATDMRYLWRQADSG